MNMTTASQHTPEFTTARLDELLARHRDKTLVHQQGGILLKADGDVGEISLTPLSKLGTPMAELLSDRETFLTRVSIHHAPRTDVGIPNAWRSRYVVPDNTFYVEYLRTGTPVPATTKSAMEGTPKVPDMNIVVNRRLARQNVDIIKSVINQQRIVSNLSKLRTPAGEMSVYSIDLQSPSGVAAEEEIVVAQKEASQRLVTYINVPVHTKAYGKKEHWKLPPDTVKEVQKLIKSVRSVANHSAHARAIDAVIDETRQLLDTQMYGEGTPAERYALAARVGLLVMLSGGGLQVNCRSGKDRTGLFDSEIKFATYQLWRRMKGMAVSKPGAPVLDQERPAWRMLLAQSGNREVQLINAGVPGNKVDSPHLISRISQELWSAYVGEARNADD